MSPTLPSPARSPRGARVRGAASLCLAVAVTAVVPLACGRSSGGAAAGVNGGAPLGSVPPPPGSAIAATPDVAVTVDASESHQRLDGFGAATAFYQNWITAHPNKAAIYDALFRGLKLDILRLQNAWRPHKGVGFAEADLDIIHGAEASLGRPVTVLMSSWAPPASLKSNRSEKNGGTLAKTGSGGYDYAGFGRYWRDSLLAYREAGIEPKYVSIQNEPDWKADYESCLFGPTEGVRNGNPVAGYDRAFDAVRRSLSALPGPPRLVGPETLGVGGGNPQAFLDPERDAARVAGHYAVAHHLYNGGTHAAPDTFVPRMRAIREDYPDKPLWMTEFGRSDGFETAWLIHNSLVEEGASAYVYWAGIWPGDDCLIGIDNPWERGRWKSPEGYRLHDRYWAVKHFSYLTAPGYRRVGAASGDPALKASAYLAPGGDWLVVVALNTSGAESRTLRLGLQAFAADGPEPARAYRTVFVAPPQKGEPCERFRDLGGLAADGRVVLPPRSVVTIAVHGRASGPAAPTTAVALR